MLGNSSKVVTMVSSSSYFADCLKLQCRSMRGSMMSFSSILAYGKPISLNISVRATSK